MASIESNLRETCPFINRELAIVRIIIPKTNKPLLLSAIPPSLKPVSIEVYEIPRKQRDKNRKNKISMTEKLPFELCIIELFYRKEVCSQYDNSKISNCTDHRDYPHSISL